MNLHEELFKAVENGDIARVKELLKMGSSFKDVEDVVKARDSLGNTLLHIAAYKGYKEIVATLLDYARSINYLWVNAEENVFNDTPLHKASINGHADIVELLLKHGAHVDATSWYGSTPLHYAAYNGHANVVKLLLESCADPSVENNIGKTPADLARERGHIEIANMIENVKELFETLKKGDTSKAEKLLANLRVPNARDRNGISLLHWATFIGHPGIVRFLIEKGADVNIKDWSGKTPLHYAAKIGDTIIAKLLLEKGADINAKDNRNCTPLHYAANVEVARLLIEKGADINARNDDGLTPLHYAVKHGHVDVIKLLIEKGVNVNIRSEARPWFASVRTREFFHELSYDKETSLPRLVVWAGECDALFLEEDGLTPLHLAAVRDSVTVATLLVLWGADIDARAESGATPLHWAAFSGSNRVAERLIERGADVNARDKMGRIPLHYASNVDVAWSLIKRGADVNARDKDGITPLHLAVREGHEDVVLILLKHGADVNAVTAQKATPLHVAAYYGKAEIAEMLIKHGADVNARSINGHTPLHYTVLMYGPLFRDDIHICGYDEEAMCRCINVLIKYGANVDAKDNSGRTPLHYAAEYGYSDVAKLLIQLGANVNARDNAGNTPFRYVIGSLSGFYKPTHYDVAKLLLENGARAEVNAMGKFGRTPLHLASASGCADLVKLLIRYDAKVNVSDTFGYTPLHYAAAAGYLHILAEIIEEEQNIFEGFPRACATEYTDIVEVLLIHGANVNAKNNKGVTPLHFAVSSGDVKIVKMLIKYGAYVNARDDEGNTPLHYATYFSCVRALSLVDLPGSIKLFLENSVAPTIKLLLENGADPTIRNSRGISALDLAEQLAVNPPEYKMAEIAKIIFTMMQSRSGTISDGKRSDSLAIVCPYCGRPAYRLGTLGRYYCFSCKRYV